MATPDPRTKPTFDPPHPRSVTPLSMNMGSSKRKTDTYVLHAELTEKEEDNSLISESSSPIAFANSRSLGHSPGQFDWIYLLELSLNMLAGLSFDQSKSNSLLDIGDRLSRLAAEQQMRSMKAYLLSYQLTRLQALVRDIEVTVADLKQDGYDSHMIQDVQLDVQTAFNNARNLGEIAVDSTASRSGVTA